MSEELLACPGCGSVIFIFRLPERKIVFHVSTHYLAFILSDGGSNDADLIDMARIHCGACSWSGGVRELVASRG